MKITLKQDNIIEIPSSIVKQLDLKPGQELNLKLGQNCILIEPVSEREKTEDILREMSENEEMDVELLMRIMEGMDL